MKPLQVPIVGEFINLRSLSVDDAAITYRWRSSSRAQHLNAPPKTVEEQAAWIASRPQSELNFVIETKEHKPVGLISLVAIDNLHKRAESARFLIGEEEAVKGIPAALEAMKMLYQLAFETLSLQRIYGVVAAGNVLMIKWQKYLGMKEEGRLRKHTFINGEFQDSVCLGILASEYYSTALPKMNTLIGAAQNSARHLR